MSDVVVVGAGVIGASIAYHLARLGAAVTLIDRSDGPAEPSASWASAGGLRSQGRHAVEQPLTTMAAARWPTLGLELDAEIEITSGGHLHLAETEAERPAIEARVAHDQTAGIDIELLGSDAIRRIVPGIAETALAGAWTPGDGQANPALVARAFAAAAARLGARIVRGTTVEPVIADGRLSHLADEHGGRLEADRVVLATGAWSIVQLRRLGLAFPLRWRALQMLSSNVAARALGPTLTAAGRNLSLKQTPDGRYMVGGRWIAAGDGDVPRAAPVEALVHAQWSGAAGLLPVLQGLRVERSWAGAEAQTIDQLPLVGPSGIGGLELAVGFSNHGFQISPALGELVASALAGTPSAALAPFRPGRFDEARRVEEWDRFIGADPAPQR